MTTVTLEGTQELMKTRDVAVILATGGMGLVRAAYSAGKPAYGVGSGQRALLHRALAPTSRRRSRDIVIGKTFDNGLLCSSPKIRSSSMRRSPRRSGASSRRRARYFLNAGRDRRAWRECWSSPQRLPNPALVGKPATVHRGEGRHHACPPARAC